MKDKIRFTLAHKHFTKLQADRKVTFQVKDQKFEIRIADDVGLVHIPDKVIYADLVETQKSKMN